MAAKISVHDLTMAYGPMVVMRDLEFEVKDKEIFVIMGGSGCGKSTLLRHLVGLMEPTKGRVLYDGEDFTAAKSEERGKFIRRFGVMYQWGALWSSLTLGRTSPCSSRRLANCPPRPCAISWPTSSRSSDWPAMRTTILRR
jgi:ABC-type transporter Mla maintaining outer membrane lipid asymmetry ATPase subunit MlaF